MKYIIFGNKGQLGRAFVNLLESKQIEYLGCDFPDYDICDYVMMNELMEEQQPEAVINCAAYSSVNAAEINFENAYRINVGGVENLAVICKN
jgi:dTDP-4-dehydrorhamnose reductase